MHDATELVRMMEPGTMEKRDVGDFDRSRRWRYFLQDAVTSGTVPRGGREEYEAGVREYNVREGYDHSYWFISTFMHDHVAFHAI